MEPREDHLDPAVEAGRARFRKLPERVAAEDMFISVPASTPDPGWDEFSHDEWLARNTWCGSLI
ncbi:hypothetical protein [Streptacidiphilus anmyonensis]|uniref:hypothetical protein n=1 Tax=Streptacidiphilus anmyonensis TaxID=405782 RepID=UPI0005A99CDC|nr:hypothetical protein [Streptacidiphilus anmyonensis]